MAQGLGGWVDKILTIGADVYTSTQTAKYAAEAQASSVPIEQAKAKSRTWLYLGIGVVGAALLFGLVKKASRS